MPLTRQDLTGVFPALVTPFTLDGALDIPALKAIVGRMFDAGCTGIVPLGGTGEYVSLSAEERVEVVATCVSATAGRGPVIAGVLSPGLSDCIATAKAFGEVGAAAVMLVTPYYNIPTQEGILDYYRLFHAAVDLPVILYEIPSKTQASYDPEVVAQLGREGIAIGLKYSNRDVVKFTEVMNTAGDLIAVMGGDDALMAAHMVLGARGAILTTANITPEAWVRCAEFGAAGDFAAAAKLNRALFPMIQTIFSAPNPGPVKEALAQAGLGVGPTCRAPVMPADDLLKARIAACLKAIPNSLPSAARSVA